MRALWTGRLPPHPGGSGISLAEIVSQVTKAGIRCRILAPVTDATRRAAERFTAAHAQLEIERYRMPQYDIAPYGEDRDELERAEESGLADLFPVAVAGFRPDLVVAGHESSAACVVALSRACGLPCVQLVRGSPTGEVLRGVYPRARTLRLLEAFAGADQIITVAKFQERGLKKLGLRRVTTIPNAIDTRRFRVRPPERNLCRDLRIGRNRIVVLVPANMHPRKRPLDVVASAVTALAANPRLVYVMAGQGALRDAVRERCRRLKLLDSFRFPGWVDYALMPALMNLADLVIMPSESEGMSRACLEAMACERTLLASDIPGARELIRDGENGRLFPAGDTRRLAALTLEMAADSQGRRKLGRQARAGLRKHTLSDVRRLYARILRSVARRSTQNGECRRPAHRNEVVQGKEEV